jgi:thiosulfate/3-mercaptopyruvate sulfurtransferase
MPRTPFYVDTMAAVPMTVLPMPIVTAEWLTVHLDKVVVADVRWYLDGRSGRDAFERGHIPNAVFADLETVLTATPGGTRGRHPLPSPEDFAAAMSALGIGDGTNVVAYDDTGGMTAARMVWMLRVLGEQAAVLDGGIAAWTGPLSTDTPVPTAQTFTARPWPANVTVDADAVGQLAARSDSAVLDARAPERYRGDTEPVDARAGHIPGARNAPWTANLDPSTGRFRSPEQLRERYAAIGVEADIEVVASCGSGVSACHDLIALELAGLGGPLGGRLFVASWSGWSADGSRPVATGSVP